MGLPTGHREPSEVLSGLQKESLKPLVSLLSDAIERGVAVRF